MIRIGEFANLFGVSIKTVRLYEEKNLIVPCYIDIYSGYRYYDEKNIEDMTKILVLKDLGLSLNEIKDFDNNQINQKIDHHEQQLRKIINNLNTLKSLSHDKESIMNMKPFINDENAIGKWQLKGVSVSKEDALSGTFIEDDYNISKLYLLPNGEKYWIVSWTKGIIYLNDVECKYEINGNTMLVNIVDPYDKEFYKVAVYNKIDNKKYTIEEIKVKDNTNLNFEEDTKLIGYFKTVDFVKNIADFNPSSKRYNDEFYLEKIIISPDNDCIALFNGDEKYSKTIKYTKGNVINLCFENTVSQYKFILDDNYIAVEWKSGDYLYNSTVNGYYILKRIN